jgi:hypothetical protein
MTLICLGGRLSIADDAKVLPKGVFRTSLDGRFYWPVDKRYDPHGYLEDLAADYNQRTLDSQAFPSLTLVENGFGMAPGSAVRVHLSHLTQHQGEVAYGP